MRNGKEKERTLSAGLKTGNTPRRVKSENKSTEQKKEKLKRALGNREGTKKNGNREELYTQERRK